MSTSEPFQMWAIVELMGHRRLAGHLTEVEIAGAGFLRLEIPSDPPVTQFYRPNTIYALTPTTEELARAVSRIDRPAPVHAFELPAPREEEDAPAEADQSNNDEPRF